jgi:hypothetical protein
VERGTPFVGYNDEVGSTAVWLQFVATKLVADKNSFAHEGFNIESPNFRVSVRFVPRARLFDITLRGRETGTESFEHLSPVGPDSPPLRLRDDSTNW